MNTRRVRIGFPRAETLAHRGRRWIDDFRNDLRIAVRHLVRAPGVSVLVTVTLAIGIGANVTMAGAIDRLLLRAPAHIGDPDRVARLFVLHRSASGGTLVGALTNYPTLLQLQREVAAFEAVAGYSRIKLSFGSGASALQVNASAVSAAFFPVLRASALIGRVFTPSDGFPVGETSGGPPLAVLSYGFWQRQFAGDRAVLNRTTQVDGITYTIVGVMPNGFRGVDADAPDLWVPMTVAATARTSSVSLGDRATVWLSIVGRLAPGSSRAVAEQQVTTTYRRNGPSAGGDTTGTVLAASVIRGQSPDAPREVRVALWLGGVSAMVLLIACANVANLLLGVAFARRRETAVRLALGAGRSRLARQILTEAMLLAGLGAVAAVVMALTGAGLLRRVFVSDFGPDGFVDARLFAFTAVIALGIGVLISLAPVLQSTAENLTTTLRGGGGGGGGGRNSRVRATLLAVQAALCMALLVGAGLFAVSLRRVEGLDLGVDIRHTLVARFDLDGLAVPKPDIDAAYHDMLMRVRAIPGVERVALADGNPYRGGRAVAAHPPGHDQDEYWHVGVDEIPMEAAVGDGFFRTVGATSLRGRDFAESDRKGAPRVAIINEPLARQLWPGQEALGQCVLLPVRGSDRGGECVTVVGVLRGFWKYNILDRDVLAVYVPLEQRTVIRSLGRPGAMYIRVTGDPATTATAIRAAIQGVRPDLPATSVTTMQNVVEPELRPWRLAATMFVLFGGVAVVIAVVGLYGVVSFSAAQRASEIAVRIALGAEAAHVLRTVAGDGLRSVATGLAAGSALALVGQRWVGPLLFQTSPRDPVIIAGAAALLLTVALLGISLPTWRALRQNPAAILRTE